MTKNDWDSFESRLDALFVRGDDPYRIGASVLFDTASDAITLDQRDLVKSVVLRILKMRADFVGEIETLRRASAAFHRIGSAIGAEKLLAREGHKMPSKLFEDLVAKKLSPDEIAKVAADGFELCVRALAAAGVPDVTIHECEKAALGEQPWGRGDG